MISVLLLMLVSSPLAALDQLRVATWHVELSRDGPGLLLREFLENSAPAIDAVVAGLLHVEPDLILLTGIDWDFENRALMALRDRIRDGGVDYPWLFARRPNRGWPTMLDLNQDGRIGTAADAQSYGRFSGQDGMGVLSRLPIDAEGARDLSSFLWADLPNADLPEVDGKPFYSDDALAEHRLSSAGHWVLPVILPSGRQVQVLAWSATAPVFDGPEDRNGRRNHDEAALWLQYLAGRIVTGPDTAPLPSPSDPVILLGKANLDPFDGEGRRGALAAILNHDRLQDARPVSDGARHAAEQDAGANITHRGPPAQDTANWGDDPGPGNLRVSYVIPDRAFLVTDSGVLWPQPDTLGADIFGDAGPLRHHLVWVDLVLD